MDKLIILLIVLIVIYYFTAFLHVLEIINLSKQRNTTLKIFIPFYLWGKNS